MTDTNKGPRFVSFDLGSKTGWAVLFDQEFILHGTSYFKKNRKIKDVSTDRGLRFAKFANLLEDLLRHGAEGVFYEKVVSHKSSDSAHMYGAFEGILLYLCYINKISVTPVYVSTIKQFIAGRGNATKDEVISAVKARGYTPETDNDADALALLFYVQEKVINVDKL